MGDKLQSKRGFPAMEVVEDVEDWLKKEKLSVEEAVKTMEEKYKKYKYTESAIQQKKTRMMEKLPEFINSLSILDILIDKKEKGESFETTYPVADELYSKAVVTNPDKVSIWIGANIMVEYDLDKAKELLLKNQTTVEEAVNELTHELVYVKDQITTTEVNMAHIYNHGVKKRQAAAALAANA